MDEEFDRQHAKDVIKAVMERFDTYDISTFKARMYEMLDAVDLRPEEDRTDFTFFNRRKDDE